MAVVPVSPVAGVVRRQNLIVTAFRAAGATSATRATTAATLGVREGLAFRILRRHAILRDGGPGHIYLDEARWESHQKTRRRMAFVCVGLALLVMIGSIVWGATR